MPGGLLHTSIVGAGLLSAISGTTLRLAAVGQSILVMALVVLVIQLRRRNATRCADSGA